MCDPKTQRLLNLWADISDSNNLFKCFKVNEIWDITILATAPSFRGKGLSKLLTHEARLEGKKVCIHLAFTIDEIESVRIPASMGHVQTH